MHPTLQASSQIRSSLLGASALGVPTQVSPGGMQYTHLSHTEKNITLNINLIKSLIYHNILNIKKD
jgi:hypothetical protein